MRANVDTLYSTAFLDVAREPIILTVPDTHGRYYLMSMMDAWTDVFASPGKRTTGTGQRAFAITGPRWKGTLPKGIQELRSPTDLVWILGRTQTNGAPDYADVHKIQDGYTLVPLSSYNRPYRPPPHSVDKTVDTKTPPVVQLERMSAASSFDKLAPLMETNPPPAADAAMLAKLATIGVVPGHAFDASKLDPAVADRINGSVSAALRSLRALSKSSGGLVNGWNIPPMALGNFGTNYRLRAFIALIAFGANLPADAMYPTAYFDADGNPLEAAHRYRVHFAPRQTPLVKAFWSITMYDVLSFFVGNPINRYAISSWMPLKWNADGSLDILYPTRSAARTAASELASGADRRL